MLHKPIEQSGKHNFCSLLASELNFQPVIYLFAGFDLIRYPEDVYDRIWEPFGTPAELAELSTAENINTANSYRPPSSIMRTAITPRNSSSPLRISWSPPDPTNEFFVYLHFADVQNNQSRQFYVYLENQIWYNQIVTPPYLRLFTVLATGGSSKATFNYSLVKIDNSTLPPIINAMEVYMVKRFLQSQTDENDGVRSALLILLLLQVS